MNQDDKENSNQEFAGVIIQKKGHDEETMIFTIVITRVTDNWVFGNINGYCFSAKVYDVGSKYGIYGGRVSKLEIRDETKKPVAEYDRGWDLMPQDNKSDMATLTLVEFFNHGPKLDDLPALKTKKIIITKHYE